MPSFLRYERVPVWDEETSDSNASPANTPQHLARHLNPRVTSNTSDAVEEQRLLSSPVSVAGTPVASAAATGATGVSLPQYVTVEDDYAPPKLDLSAPPPYSECDDNGAAERTVVVRMDHDGGNHCMTHSGVNPSPELVGAMLAPPIDGTSDCLQPPSYEEVQRIKAVEAQLENNEHILLPPHTTSVTLTDAAGEARAAEEDLLGTDLLFFLSFAAAFFFNWVGFVVLVCFCHSVAGRSGALAGFGLSLAKWAVIVRHSTVLAAQANTWLLWLIIVLGLVICMRAVLQYLNAKREWHHASQASRHRFLLFH